MLHFHVIFTKDFKSKIGVIKKGRCFTINLSTDRIERNSKLELLLSMLENCGDSLRLFTLDFSNPDPHTRIIGNTFNSAIIENEELVKALQSRECVIYKFIED
jgi:hypothetical protein